MPYLNTKRNYNYPNHYAQVIIYSKIESKPVIIKENTNSVAIDLNNGIRVLANIITKKDQWDKSSSLVFSDRYEQQVKVMDSILNNSCIILGDFNFRLRKGRPSPKSTYSKFKKFIDSRLLIWATLEETNTVQHIVHSENLVLDYEVRDSEKLSDHPIIIIGTDKIK